MVNKNTRPMRYFVWLTRKKCVHFLQFFFTKNKKFFFKLSKMILPFRIIICKATLNKIWSETNKKPFNKNLWIHLVKLMQNLLACVPELCTTSLSFSEENTWEFIWEEHFLNVFTKVITTFIHHPLTIWTVDFENFSDCFKWMKAYANISLIVNILDDQRRYGERGGHKLSKNWNWSKRYSKLNLFTWMSLDQNGTY